MDQRMSGRVEEGMDVLDRNGQKIGKAGESLGQYFNVDSGFLGMKEYYVPYDAVTDVREDAAIVNVDKDNLDRMGWDQRPDERNLTTDAGSARMDRADTTRMGRAEGDTLQLREEELEPRKHMEQTGEVKLRKEVHTEHRTMDVPVSREEVVVERHPVDRRPADSADFRPEGETIRVPVREEQVTVEKRPVVTEEVTVGKRPVTDTQKVSGTVRREEAKVVREGDIDVADEGASGAWNRQTDRPMSGTSPGHQHQWVGGRCSCGATQPS